MLRRAKAAYFFYGAPPSDEALRLQIKLGTRDGEPPDNAAVQIQARTRRAKANPLTLTLTLTLTLALTLTLTQP